MKKYLLLLFMATGWAQQFPDAIVGYSDLLVRSPAAGYLSQKITSSQTTLILRTVGLFQANMSMTIGTEEIFCTTLTDRVFSGCTRGFAGTTAEAHVAGSPISGSLVLRNIARELIAIENALGVNNGNVSQSALLSTTAVIDLVAVPDGACVLDSTAVTLSGAALGGRTIVGSSVALPEGVDLFAKVTGPNTVKIEICNQSGATYDAASATYHFGVQP